MALAKICIPIVDKNVEDDILVFDLRGKEFNISLSSMMLAIVFFLLFIFKNCGEIYRPKHLLS